jgi:hypothetical protein
LKGTTIDVVDHAYNRSIDRNKMNRKIERRLPTSDPRDDISRASHHVVVTGHKRVAVRLEELIKSFQQQELYPIKAFNLLAGNDCTYDAGKFHMYSVYPKDSDDGEDPRRARDP